MHTRSTPHVVIAGGSFAALEAALALRALAADRLRLTLISPGGVFAYRPSATVEASGEADIRAYDLESITSDFDIAFHRSRLDAVASKIKRIRLGSGAYLDYDSLILAIGSRSIASVPGALTFRDQRDLRMFRRLLDEIDTGSARRPVFVVPSGCSWPLPLYELALQAAFYIRERGLDADVTLVTPEHEPLQIFGSDASLAVAELLADADVRFAGAHAAGAVRRDGTLELQFEGVIHSDRVLAVPQLRGQRISGIPASWWGFVPTDADGRVEGLLDVYAAGDITASPIKQGGLGLQQADRVAHVVAAGYGIGAPPPDPRRVLRARLMGGSRPLFLRAELDERGHPTATSVEPVDGVHAQTWTKVFGRYLTPYLEGRQPIMGDRPLVAA